MDRGFPVRCLHTPRDSRHFPVRCAQEAPVASASPPPPRIARRELSRNRENCRSLLRPFCGARVRVRVRTASPAHDSARPYVVYRAQRVTLVLFCIRISHPGPHTARSLHTLRTLLRAQEPCRSEMIWIRLASFRLRHRSTLGMFPHRARAVTHGADGSRMRSVRIPVISGPGLAFMLTRGRVLKL